MPRGLRVGLTVGRSGRAFGDVQMTQQLAAALAGYERPTHEDVMLHHPKLELADAASFAKDRPRAMDAARGIPTVFCF